MSDTTTAYDPLGEIGSDTIEELHRAVALVLPGASAKARAAAAVLLGAWGDIIAEGVDAPGLDRLVLTMSRHREVRR